MAKSNPGKSFVLSVLSVLIALLQLFLYSVGTVRQQLSRAINLDSDAEAKAVARAIFGDYGGQQNVTFEMAVKFYFNNEYPLSDRFIEESRDDFKAEGETVDFSKNVQAAKTINDWVANQTHNEIKDLVPAQALSASTRLVLVNALYFRGLFVRPFDVNKTKDGDFYVSPDKTISIPFMHQTASFGYCNSAPLNAQILKMDYVGGNFSLIVVLPNERFGLEEVVDKMRDADIVLQMLDCLRTEKVKVSMPRYEIEESIDMADLCKKANLSAMFDPNSNGFTGILKNEEPLFLSAALQKAKITSDEKGTTAAAATAIIVGTTSAIFPPPEIPEFDANHPHAYSIYNKGDPAFSGVFSG